MKKPKVEPISLPLKRGRKTKFSEIEFIIPDNIQYGLVVITTPPLKKHTRRPPLLDNSQ